MTPFARNVQHTLERYRMLGAGDRILAAVSGGADSLALLFVLRELGYDPAVAHLNHGLRGEEADEDERFVSNLAAGIGVRFFGRRESVSEQGGNVEAAGRTARRDFFRFLSETYGFTKIALAHHREDRVETFLLHLMRGAGTEGLVSMAPVSGMTIRPLIETPRAEIEKYLEDRNQPWRSDQTNADISFARNRVRHQLIPLLVSSLIPAWSKGFPAPSPFCRTKINGCRRWRKPGWLSTMETTASDARALRSAPPALARRVIRTRLRQAGSQLTDLTFDHVEAVRNLLEDGKSGKVLPLPGGLVAAREFDQLVFLDSEEQVEKFDYELPIPGAVHIRELGQVFRAEYVEKPNDANSLSPSFSRVFVDGSRLGAHVNIRNWKPGDYYKPAGWPAGKVKKLFQRARVPRRRRRRWPVFVTDATIIWVASFPVSREFVPGGHSEKIVAFEALQGYGQK